MAKGVLVRKNYELLKLKKNNEIICKTILKQGNKLNFIVKVHINFDKKKK